MRQEPLTNRAVVRISATFKTELEGGITLSGSGHVRAELPMDEQQLREFVHKPEDSIEAVLVGLNGHIAREG